MSAPRAPSPAEQPPAGILGMSVPKGLRMIDASGSVTPSAAQGQFSKRWIGLAVLFTAVFVSVLDNFIVFVAIPSIRSDLEATFSQVEFVVAGYTLTFE